MAGPLHELLPPSAPTSFSVPEGKTAKNRVHLDVSIGGEPGTDDATRRSRIEQHAVLLAGAGATEVDRVEEFGEFWVVMQDPEGNEFCIT